MRLHPSLRPLAVAPAALLLAGCVHVVQDLRDTAVACGVRGDFRDEAVAAVHFVTSRSADCAGGSPVFGRGRAKRIGYGHIPRDQQSSILTSRQDWLRRLRDHLRAANGRALLYVHGYNTSFDQAARRAVRIAARAQFAGPVIIFSWPSHARVSRYTWDEENALWAQPQFDALLQSLLADSSVQEVLLVAHSMGNRIALRSLAELDRAKPDLTVRKVRTVVLAAPDLDRSIFVRDFAPSLARRGRRTTVYVSRVDRPLRASWAVHGFPRAGDSGCAYLDIRRGRHRRRCFVTAATPQVPPGVRVIETSLVRGSPLGHSDFVDSEVASTDLCRVLNGEREFPERERAGSYRNVFFLVENAAAPPCPSPAAATAN